MGCTRLILEAGRDAVTVRFHPRLTAVAGVGRLELGEPFGGLDATQEWELLELVRTADAPQAIILTEDKRHRGLGPGCGCLRGLSVLEPGPTGPMRTDASGGPLTHARLGRAVCGPTGVL